jgi:hypothetical protein
MTELPNFTELTEWAAREGVMELRGQVRSQMEFGNEVPPEGRQEGKIVRGPSTAPKQVRLAQDDGLLNKALPRRGGQTS